VDLESRVGKAWHFLRKNGKRHLLDASVGTAVGIAFGAPLELTVSLIKDVDWSTVYDGARLLTENPERAWDLISDGMQVSYYDALIKVRNTRVGMATLNFAGQSFVYGMFRAGYLRYKGISEDSPLGEVHRTEGMANNIFFLPIYGTVRAFSGVTSGEVIGSLFTGAALGFFLGERYGRWRDNWFHWWGEDAARKGGSKELNGTAARVLNTPISELPGMAYRAVKDYFSPHVAPSS
jgi:hypothetical protein